MPGLASPQERPLQTCGTVPLPQAGWKSGKAPFHLLSGSFLCSQIAGYNRDVCIDSPCKPEDMHKPVGLWPCHSQGGNQVKKATGPMCIKLLPVTWNQTNQCRKSSIPHRINESHLYIHIFRSTFNKNKLFSAYFT